MIIKKIIYSILLSVVAFSSVNAQILRTEELIEFTINNYGEDWVVEANKLKQKLTLDELQSHIDNAKQTTINILKQIETENG